MYGIFDTNHHGVAAPLKEIVPLARKYGIGGVNVPQGAMTDEKAGIEAGKLLFDNGLKWSLLPTPVDFLSEDLDEAAFTEGIETLKRWAAIGEKMGVRYSYNHVWNGSNSRKYAENFEWNLIRIRRIWRVMHDHGIRYGMEFLGPHPLRNSFRYPFFNSISGILALADAVDSSCGFLFDTYHWYTGSDASMCDLYLAAQHAHRMVCLHINDGIAGRAREEQQDLERALPLTTGVIDAALPYRMFAEKGYAGPVLCESMRPFSNNPRSLPLEDVIKTVGEAYGRVRQAAAQGNIE